LIAPTRLPGESDDQVVARLIRFVHRMLRKLAQGAPFGDYGGLISQSRLRKAVAAEGSG
jgi:hypothetical protein